jgi:hypothetical protein
MVKNAADNFSGRAARAEFSNRKRSPGAWLKPLIYINFTALHADRKLGKPAIEFHSAKPA